MHMAKIMMMGQEKLKYRQLHQANISAFTTSHHFHRPNFEHFL